MCDGQNVQKRDIPLHQTINVGTPVFAWNLGIWLLREKTGTKVELVYQSLQHNCLSQRVACASFFAT